MPVCLDMPASVGNTKWKTVTLKESAFPSSLGWNPLCLFRLCLSFFLSSSLFFVHNLLYITGLYTRHLHITDSLDIHHRSPIFAICKNRVASQQPPGLNSTHHRLPGLFCGLLVSCHSSSALNCIAQPRLQHASRSIPQRPPDIHRPPRPQANPRSAPLISSTPPGPGRCAPTYSDSALSDSAAIAIIAPPNGDIYLLQR